MNGKMVVVILSGILALMLCSNSCIATRSSPVPTDTQFTVAGNKIYRLNIYANRGQTIKGSWKADKAVYRWWTSPGGAAYPLEQYTSRITGVFEPTPLDPEPGFWIEGKIVEHSMAGMWGGDINIKCDHPYGESGYYTICFMPYDKGESVNVIIRYWVQ